jgi:LuxR family maltose regulon positive regulatory protein
LPVHVVRASPQLCVISAWLIFLTTQAHSFLFWLDAAEEALHSCEETISQATAATLQGEIVALRAANKLYLSDINSAIATCNQVLASLPPDNLYARSLILLMLGLAYQRGVNVAAAAQALSEANSSSQAIGHGLLLPYVMIAQAELYELQGHPFEAMNVYQQVLKLTNGRTGHPTGIAYASLGYLFWEWHNLETARHYLLQAWDVGIRADNNNIVSETALWLVQLELDQGRTSEANYWLQQWEWFIQKAGTYEVLSIVAALRAQISLEQGRLDDALLWMQNHMPSPEDDIAPRHEIEYFVQVRTLIDAGRTYADKLYMQQAMTLLEHLRQAAQGIGRTKTLIRTLIYQALVCYFQEDLEGALAALERALLLAEPGRYIRVFVVKGDPMLKLLRRLRDRYKACKSQECPINLAYVRRLLATFPQPTARIEPMTGSEEYTLLEPLSWREREVLRLVAAGRKNQEIAKELVVVTGTVKAHINSIYRKLSVNSRVQAVARARALNLL